MILQALKAVFVSKENLKLLKVSLKELRLNMVVAKDIRNVQDQLLLAKGQHLNQWMIDQLRQISQQKAIKEPIYVVLGDSSEDPDPGRGGSV